MWAFLPLIIFGVIVGVFVVIGAYSWQKEKERTRQLQLTASQLGWSFAVTAPLNMIAGLERFALFNQGQSKKIKNFMYGEATGIKAAVFDYVYVTGYGKNRQTHYQSIVYLEPSHLSLPFFSLRPEGLLYKIFTAFGYQDIDFGQRPEFSKRYILRGPDEQAIRRTFNDGLLSFYENYSGTCTDGGGNQLFIFRGGYRFQPQEIQSYVGLGLSVMNLFPRYQWSQARAKESVHSQFADNAV
ncbi:MAG TPA: hypothetical protein VK582_08490 [Pyrinomonadaceae bacterium]|nr:hypothetical protein [Pyrinomonadaceae bacterium]